MKRDTRSVFEGLLLAWASVVKKHHVWFLAVVGAVAISSMVLAQPGHVPQPSATPTPTGAPPLPPSLPAAAPAVEAASIAGGRVVTYTYDEAGRLVGADYGGGSSISYAYDAGGNLVSREVETAVQCDKLTNVEITAPATTTVGEATNFTASVTPMTATTELTFTWRATGQVGQQRVAVVSDTVVFTWPMTGPQKVTVTAANPCSVAVSDTHSITATNEPPVADARPGQSVTIGDVVTLDGSGSSDPDGHMPLAYGWAQVGGPDVSLSSSATVSPTFTAPGTPTVLTFTLTVTDAYGLASAPDTVVVAVGDVPITGLSAENSSPTTLGDATLFTATITGGTNVSYEWAFGDGNTGTGAAASHTYGAAGIYTATVTASNGSGELGTTTAVSVKERQYMIHLPSIQQLASSPGAIWVRPNALAGYGRTYGRRLALTGSVVGSDCPESTGGKLYLFRGRRCDADAEFYVHGGRRCDPTTGRPTQRGAETLGNPYTFSENNSPGGLTR